MFVITVAAGRLINKKKSRNELELENYRPIFHQVLFQKFVKGTYPIRYHFLLAIFFLYFFRLIGKATAQTMCQ